MIERTGGAGSLAAVGGVGAGPVVDDLAALVRRRPAVGATRLVTLDGHSGAGKTRLAGRLARALGRAPVVHLDFFYPGWDGLAAGVELAVGWVARPLTAGRPARWQRYDWKAGGFAEWQETPWAPVVVLEGCGAGSAALRPYASTAVWVDTPARPARRPVAGPHRLAGVRTAPRPLEGAGGGVVRRRAAVGARGRDHRQRTVAELSVPRCRMSGMGQTRSPGAG